MRNLQSVMLQSLSWWRLHIYAFHLFNKEVLRITIMQENVWLVSRYQNRWNVSSPQEVYDIEIYSHSNDTGG